MSADISLDNLTSMFEEISKDSYGYYMAVTSDGTIISDPSNMDNNLTNISDSYNPQFATAVTSNANFEKISIQGDDYLVKSISSENTGWIYVSVVDEYALNEVVRNTSIIIYITMAIIIAVAVAFALIISSRIAKPINAVIKSANEVANGDLTVVTDIKSNDELGELGSNFNEMLERIRGLISNVKISSGTVADTSDSILEMTKETNSAMNEVTQAIQEVARGSQEQATEIDKNSQNINELARVIDGVNDSSIEANKLADEAKELGNKGLEQVEILIDRSDKNSSASNNVNNIIFEVKKSAEEINTITETITQIAGQTNLLALNAAIEAARAGEAGRGFAVVADEIRKLAEQSSEATHNIGALIANMNNKTNEAVGAMEVAKDAVAEQIVSVDSTKDIFGRILVAVQDLDAKISEIKSSTAEMDARKNNIVENMQNISAVSEETSASTEEVSASSEEVTAITNTFVEYSENLKKLSADLIGLVDVFTV